jgi:parallel beta-helix repeat protein
MKMDHSGLSRYIGSTVTTLLILCLLSASFAYAKTIYVDSEATGANDGTSWNDAYVDLQVAVDAAESGDEIWVAAGTYRPTSWPNGGSEDRERHFSLRNGVAVYGGFVGTETSLSQRDVETKETILSGGNYCYHVFYHPEGTDLDASAILDGVTITRGNANGPYHHYQGGGMYNRGSSPTLSNCTITRNSARGWYEECDNSFWPIDPPCWENEIGEGGGMYNSSSSPTLTNCTFSENSAFDRGGGMYNSSSSPILINCTFSGNSAFLDRGDGIYNSSSSPTLTNCIINGNEYDGIYNFSSSPTLSNCIISGNEGTGIRNRFDSSPILVNCTISGNKAYGIYNYSSSPELLNCILWGNYAGFSGNEIRNYQSSPIITFCNIKDSFRHGVWDEELGRDGGHNIDSDPLFVRNPGTNGEDDPGDLHLTSDSPCIDTGDPSVTDGEDIDEEIRVFDGDGDGVVIVDMGVDEYVDSDYDGIVDRNETPGIIASTVGGNTGEDGTSITFDVRLNSPPDGDVILFIESTDDSEGTVSPITLTFTTLNWSTDQTVTVIGVDDDMVDGDQTYYVQVTVDSDNTQDTTGYLDLDEVDISVTNTDDGNDDGGSNGGDGSDGGDGGTEGSNGSGVSSEGGSSGGCFINTLFDAGE